MFPMFPMFPILQKKFDLGSVFADISSGEQETQETQETLHTKTIVLLSKTTTVAMFPIFAQVNAMVYLKTFVLLSKTITFSMFPIIA